METKPYQVIFLLIILFFSLVLAYMGGTVLSNHFNKTAISRSPETLRHYVNGFPRCNGEELREVSRCRDIVTK